MTEPTRQLKGSQLPDDLLLKWVECHEPWATWMRPGGCLESAHLELTALLRKAIAAADVGVSQPEQPAATERRFVQVMRADNYVYAVADDGTAWVRNAMELDWSQMRGLPPRDA